jgi:hypothetical protein
MKRRHSWSRDLIENSSRILVVFALAAPAVPALIAFAMRSRTGSTGQASTDSEILSAWTYLQVAVIALYTYLTSAGPPNYLTAYTFTMLPHAVFMQKLGQPIGIWLARCFNGLGISDPYSATLATYVHHVLVAFGTWLMAVFVISIMKGAQKGSALTFGHNGRYQ